MGRREIRVTRFLLPLALLALTGCQSMSNTVDRLVPPWGPPEQWEPGYTKTEAANEGGLPNYAAIFGEDA